MHIKVSAHAISRFKERFGLLWSRHMSDRRMIESVIIGQLSTARKVEKWKTVPFYYNRYRSTYGPYMEVYVKGQVYYIVTEHDGMLLVRTVSRAIRGC